MPLGSHSNFKRAKELANSDFERRNFGKKKEVTLLFGQCVLHMQITWLSVHTWVSRRGSLLPGASPGFQTLPPHACLDPGSFGSIVPASCLDTKLHLLGGSCKNINETKHTIVFYFYWKHVKTQRRGSHRRSHSLCHLARPHPAPQVTPPFQNHNTLCTQSLGWAVPKLWLLLSRGPGPPSHLFL